MVIRKRKREGKVFPLLVVSLNVIEFLKAQKRGQRNNRLNKIMYVPFERRSLP